MNETLLYIPENTPALVYAGKNLAQQGIPIAKQPVPNVTHILLPIPTKKFTLPDEIPETATVIGGNFQDCRHKTVDILTDETYLQENARITAYCALKIAMEHLPIILSGCPTLVIGYGRIGKQLSALLTSLGTGVTVASRDPGQVPARFSAVETGSIEASGFRLIFNTVPYPVLRRSPAYAISIDLASSPGILGDDVITARGLPGKIAPESSGALIAETVLRYLKKEAL